MSTGNKTLTLQPQFFLKEESDFESIQNKAVGQLKSGKPLLGKDGAFAPLLASISALEGEMDAHLTEEERQAGNRRDGKMQKRVRTSSGKVAASAPRTPNSSFEARFIRKRETIPSYGWMPFIVHATMYGVLNREGHKELFGMYISRDGGQKKRMELFHYEYQREQQQYQRQKKGRKT